MIPLVAQDELAILKSNADGLKPMPIRALEIVDPDGSKPSRAHSCKLFRIALRGATARCLHVLPNQLATEAGRA